MSDYTLLRNIEIEGDDDDTNADLTHLSENDRTLHTIITEIVANETAILDPDDAHNLALVVVDELPNVYKSAAELKTALQATVASLMNYIPKAAKGHAEGCFKYTAGGWDMWNCSCSICHARRAIANAATDDPVSA